MGCLESGWGGGTGKEGREGGKEIPFGNKEKALNLQIPPTEAKPTPNQPQLGAQEPVNKCEGASQMTAPVLNAFTPRCCWASAPQLTRLSPPPPSSSPHSSLWLLNHLPLITPQSQRSALNGVCSLSLALGSSPPSSSPILGWVAAIATQRGGEDGGLGAPHLSGTLQ